MAKNSSNTKSRIVSAAWKLFYEQGYDNTTIDEIIEESETSRGSFYHYFKGKDSLLSTLSTLFDEKYEELMESTSPSMNSIEKLIYFNQELFGMIESKISIDLLAKLYSTQIISGGDGNLLDRNRVYYKILRKIIIDGQERGEICETESVNDIVKTYSLCERALICDWCICNGEYSLKDYSKKMMSLFMNCYKK